MKTVTISRLMGKMEIPAHYKIVKTGVTRPKDQVSQEAGLRFFKQVAVGGIPVNRYFAVIRPDGKAHRVWSKTRKIDRPVKNSA